MVHVSTAVVDDIEESYEVAEPAIPNTKVPERKLCIQSETVLPSDEGDDRDTEDFMADQSLPTSREPKK
jgi:hypothetical protein